MKSSAGPSSGTFGPVGVAVIVVGFAVVVTGDFPGDVEQRGVGHPGTGESEEVEELVFDAAADGSDVGDELLGVLVTEDGGELAVAPVAAVEGSGELLGHDGPGFCGRGDGEREVEVALDVAPLLPGEHRLGFAGVVVDSLESLHRVEPPASVVSAGLVVAGFDGAIGGFGVAQGGSQVVLRIPDVGAAWLRPGHERVITHLHEALGRPPLLGVGVPLIDGSGIAGGLLVHAAQDGVGQPSWPALVCEDHLDH